MRPIDIGVLLAAFCSAAYIAVEASRCLQEPLSAYIPDGCNVLNLTVTTSSGEFLAVDWKCNQTVDNSKLQNPPIVTFTKQPVSLIRNQTYLFIMMDKTTSQLLWMIGNITVVNKQLTSANHPSYGPFKNSLTLRSYQAPMLNRTSNNHSIEFLVFEERYVGFGPSYVASNVHLPFNLKQWLQKQLHYGTMLCGPVAGSKLVASAKFSQPSYYPPSYNVPSYPVQPSYNPYPSNPSYPSQQPYNPQHTNNHHNHQPPNQQPAYYPPPPPSVSSHYPGSYAGQSFKKNGASTLAVSSLVIMIPTMLAFLL